MDDQNVKPDPKDDPREYGRGQRPRPPYGVFKGLVAAITSLDDEAKVDDDPSDYPYDLPPDVALIGHFGSDPTTLDEAMQGPNVQGWQKALEYEINQLEKLKTWVVEDLPKGQTAIPCTGVTRVKRGPDGEVQSYRVRIVAGGHRQVEGVNYTETFSAAAKMPTVRVVLANAAHQDWEIEHTSMSKALT
jgi:hypothetical protein